MFIQALKLHLTAANAGGAKAKVRPKTRKMEISKFRNMYNLLKCGARVRVWGHHDLFRRIGCLSLSRVEPFDSIVLISVTDLAPKFYPVLSSLWLVDLPGWVVVATGAGAEPSA